MARVPFGHYTAKTDHLALLGSNHRCVTSAGKGNGKDVFHGLFQPLLAFMASLFIFLCKFQPLLAPPLDLQQGSRQGDQRVPQHTTRGPERAPLVCIVPFWPLGGSLAPQPEIVQEEKGKEVCKQSLLGSPGPVLRVFSLGASILLQYINVGAQAPWSLSHWSPVLWEPYLRILC